MTSERLLNVFHNQYYSFIPAKKTYIPPQNKFMATPLALSRDPYRFVDPFQPPTHCQLCGQMEWTIRWAISTGPGWNEGPGIGKGLRLYRWRIRCIA